MESKREFDSSQEQKITQFMQEYYFNKVFTYSDIVTDKSLQIRGVDIIADGCNYDLKAQTNYINEPLPTFILELCFYNRRKELMAGWFVNKTVQTDYYAFIWIPDAKVESDKRLVSYQDIEQVELMIVPRRELKDYIFSIIPEQKLYDAVNYMYQSGEKYKTIEDGIKLCYSSQLFEKPINLVIKKWRLKQIAVDHCMITKSEITYL